ncbi:MAG: type II secretion system F family protein [Ahrensia sp.]
MSSSIAEVVFSGQFLIAVLIAISVFATVLSLVAPMVSGNELRSRMKSVAIERDEIRARERARMKVNEKNGNLRMDRDAGGMSSIVEKLDLRKALADDKTIANLRAAGFRGQRPLNIFLFTRFVLPFVTLAIGAVYIFGLQAIFADKPFFFKLSMTICSAGIGFYLPNLYVTNAASKRKASIQRAWPDSLDLMLICVESGMSIEAAFKRVAQEIGTQSIPLAEELVLVGAELSYLSERRQAYENFGTRTGLDTVRAVMQALIQAERYGTPIGQALRVLAAESREMRMNAAEKKAAALPPKLTVPMILFFLPVLFAIILGPAAMTISASNAFDEPDFADTPPTDDRPIELRQDLEN